MRETIVMRAGLLLAGAVVFDSVSRVHSIEPDIVTVEGGIVRGTAREGILSWKGIPFAAPPIGPLRWRVPQPLIPWQGVRDATMFGASCMQTDTVVKSEDCLTLNVWRPERASQMPMPVMVWIPGGVLVHGGTSVYPAAELARQGVVVVTANYRLGRLGFFAHPALTAEARGEVAGNYGFMDQLAALTWVKRNIAAFGGDPGNVTLAGQAAGGGSVLVHLTSPLSRRLFNRVILESPALPTPRARVLSLTSLRAAEQMGADYARSVGIGGTDTPALAALRALPAETLTEGTSGDAAVAALGGGPPIIGLPGAILDGRLIVEAPEEALRAGHQAAVPTIAGANDRDITLGDEIYKPRLFSYFGPDSNRAKLLYDPHGMLTVDALRQQVNADRAFVEPVRHLADEINRSGQSVWLYRFSYVDESQRGTVMGAVHGAEIPYVFNAPGLLNGAPTTSDVAMAEAMSGYWVAFAKTGNPNGPNRPWWPRHEPGIDRLMHFTNIGVIAGTDPIKPRIDLWERVWLRAAAAPATHAR